VPNQQQPEITNFVVKGVIYVCGILLGLMAKLAYISKEKPLTMKDFFIHGTVAFACAWCVWALLEHYGYLDYANISSVIVGRYGDYILMAIWKAIKNAIETSTKK